jgi:hypothetical protein
MLTTDLDATYNDYVPYSGDGRLNENVAALFDKVEEHETRLDSAETTIGNHTSTLATHTREISQINEDIADSGWVKFDTSHNAYYRKIGKIVTIKYEGNIPANTDIALATLPFSIPHFNIALSTNHRTNSYCADEGGNNIHLANNDTGESHYVRFCYTTLIN